MFLPAAMGRILFFSIDISPRSYMILTLFYRCFTRKIDITHHNSALSILLQIGKGVKKFFVRRLYLVLQIVTKRLEREGYGRGMAEDARTASVPKEPRSRSAKNVADAKLERTSLSADVF